MPNNQLSSHALLCDEVADQHFWNNLAALNLKKNNNDTQTCLTLTALQQQIRQRHVTQMEHKKRRAAIKEQAIKLFCSEFSTAEESLKKQLVRGLYHPHASIEALWKLVQTVRVNACDQLLGELTEPFCRSAYHFVTVMADHKIVAREKPAAIYFDQSRAFALLHDPCVQSLVSKINLAEQTENHHVMPAITFHTLQNYHPFVVNKSQEQCQQAFNDTLCRKLHEFSALMMALQQEYQRVEQKRPFFLLRPFYDNTMQAIDVWQYELLAQQLQLLQHLSITLKKYRMGLVAWLQELNRTGPISFLLPKKFRDFFIQLVIDKNDTVVKNYHHILKQLRAKNKRAQLQQDLTFLTGMAQDMQDNKSQLLAVLQSDLATVDVAKVSIPVRVEWVAEEKSYRDAWVAGEKIPEINLSGFIAKEVKLVEQNSVNQRQWLESVKQKLCEKLADSESTLSRNALYIKQVLELFLQLKKDSLLTQIKKTLAQLPKNSQEHVICKYCMTQIGLTVAERLEQVQRLKDGADQTCKIAEAKLMRQLGAHQLLVYHIQKLLRYALDHNVCTVQQLSEAQAEDTQLVSRMAGVQAAQCRAQELFEKIIFIAQNSQLLSLYAAAEKKLQCLYQQDKFVPEVALPIPTLHQPSHVMMRRVF